MSPLACWGVCGVSRTVRTRLILVSTGVWAIVGWVAVWGTVSLFDVNVTRVGDRTAVRLVAGVLAGVVGLLVVVMRAKGGVRVDEVVVGATSVLAAAMVTVGLHGTRWSF